MHSSERRWSSAMRPSTRLVTASAPALPVLVLLAACTIRVIQPAAVPAPGAGPKADSAKKDLPWKPFAEVTKDARVSTGLFTAYLKRENAYLALKPEQLDHDYRSEEHTSELQSRLHLVCRLLLEKKKKINNKRSHHHSTIAVLDCCS